MIYPAGRLADLMVKMRQYGMEPKRVRIVYPGMGSDAKLAMVEATLGGRSGLKILPPLMDQGGLFYPELSLNSIFFIVFPPSCSFNFSFMVSASNSSSCSQMGSDTSTLRIPFLIHEGLACLAIPGPTASSHTSHILASDGLKGSVGSLSRVVIISFKDVKESFFPLLKQYHIQIS